MLLPAGLTVAFGLFPGALLHLATPALERLLGPAAAPPVQGLAGMTLSAGEGSSAYLPLVAGLLLAVAGGAIAWAVRRRSPLPTARGPVWNCGFIDPPAHLPFGDPWTQPGAGGIAQPLRRMLGGAVFAARERVDMPEPGDVRPGRYAATFIDPSDRLLLRPLRRLRDGATARTEALRSFTVRRSLSLSFGALVALLALLAWLEAR
jgi:hypothetical protein